MAKKIYLSPSSQNENAYATGNTTEQTQCRKIATACANYLKQAGFEVKCANYGTMYSRTSESNSWGADLHIPIHTNAFNGKITGGTQIYMSKLTGEHKKVAQAVFNRLAPLTIGTSHEKIVKNNSFYEINNANAITVYMECEFHDTKAGADFIRANTTAIGEAIAKGVCDYYGVKVNKQESVSKPTVSTPTTKPVATNATVKEWQQSAIKDGYKFPKYGADGSWGSECDAVAKTAICKKQLIGYKNKNLTKFVQKVVGVTADGLFGNDTKKAVIAYQKKKGLTADGVVGYNTWKKILGVK